MRRLLRLFTLCLLALALPLQGVAAAAAMAGWHAGPAGIGHLVQVSLAPATVKPTGMATDVDTTKAGMHDMQHMHGMRDMSGMQHMHGMRDMTGMQPPHASPLVTAAPTTPDATGSSLAARPAAPPPAPSPCPHHADDKAGCGACCGPAVTQRPALAVVPVADRWAPARRLALPVAAPVFLTDGPDRPPRSVLA